MNGRTHSPLRHVFARVLVATVCLPFLPSCSPPEKSGAGADIPKEQDEALRKIVQEEVAKILSTTTATDAGAMRKQIDALILEEIRKQLSGRDWEKEFNSERVAQALERVGKAAGQGNGPQEQVDLTGISTIEGKMNRILEEFAGSTSFYHGSPLVQQLRELGPESKQHLMAALKKQRGDHQNWATLNAISSVLGDYLNESDMPFLLEDIRSSNPMFVDTAIQMNFSKVGDAALAHLSTSTGKERLNHKLVEAALHFHEEKTIPLVVDAIRNGSSNAAYHAQKLRQLYPDLPLRDALQAAAHRAESGTQGQELYARKALAPILLSEGIPQGLLFAADALLDTNNEHFRSQVRTALRRYVNVLGTDEDIAAYLMENRNNLRWNPQDQMFEEIHSSQ